MVRVFDRRGNSSCPCQPTSGDAATPTLAEALRLAGSQRNQGPPWQADPV